MTARTALRCAVAGPLCDGIEIGEILEGTVIDVLDVAVGQNPTAIIRRADFVVAFLDDNVPSTLVDVGIAVALKKPLLLIAETSHDIPDRLLGFPWLLTQGLTREDLALQLRSFASAFLPKPTTSTESSVARRGPRLEEAVAKAPKRGEVQSWQPTRELNREQFHSDVEFQVAETLSRAGATVVAQVRDSHELTIPDMAASFPELGASFSTVLIEVVGRMTSITTKKAALRAGMDQRGTLLGMLVTLEELADPDPSPGIIVLSIDRLIDLVESNQMLPTLRLARNRVVHRAG